jgi:hypothetical protein
VTYSVQYKDDLSEPHIWLGRTAKKSDFKCLTRLLMIRRRSLLDEIGGIVLYRMPLPVYCFDREAADRDPLGRPPN